MILFTLSSMLIKNKKYEDYKLISEINYVDSYKVALITNREPFFQFGNEFTDISDSTKLIIPSRDEEKEGYIYFNRATKSFWIESQNHSAPNEWINFDMNGKIISIKEGDFLKKSPGEIIKSEITDTYEWNDKSSHFFVSYFHKQKYNWARLNPLNGMGNPTGISSKISWEGTAYMNLLMKDATIKFKTQNYSKSYGGYAFEPILFRIDNAEALGEIVLLYIRDEYHSGLYMISKIPNR